MIACTNVPAEHSAHLSAEHFSIAQTGAAPVRDPGLGDCDPYARGRVQRSGSGGAL